jgi:hypothetical protein
VNRIMLDDLEKLVKRRRLDVNFNQHADHGNSSFNDRENGVRLRYFSFVALDRILFQPII